MQIKYCLPIIKNKKNHILRDISLNMSNYYYFEVWLDYIDALDNAFVKQLIDLLGEKLVLLFRRQNLEKVKMNLEEKLKILSILENTQSLIDLDIFDQKEELEYIKSNKLEVKTIVSYHNYEKTPENEKLLEIIDRMNIYKPSIYKIAAMCASQNDALRLLQLLLKLKEKNLKYIISGMGGFGTITRIFGALWGNEMVFAPKTAGGQSAPGQLTKKQLENIFKELKG